MISKPLVKCVLNPINVFLHRYQSRAGSSMVYTNKLLFANEMFSRVIPTYRVLNNTHLQESPTIQDLKMEPDMLIKMYTNMISVSLMDTILYESQRQGRISFYMTNSGEEGVQIGSAAALHADDLVYAQYRESGILLWRGFSFQDFINQCYGNYKDESKGRQMPVHYGSKKLHFVTISSPLATQLPQAVGAAYGQKQVNSELCVVCYFGEGAASEGDTHAAFNFAATLACPIIFICRNNGYAISTPIHQQYNGDGIAAKGPAYGINTLRVDGNDIIAMYNATKYARKYAIEKRKPVLIEAMTYRIGHHSTSDDSTVYRSREEIQNYQTLSPIVRFRTYLEHCGLWNEEKEKQFINLNKELIMQAITEAEQYSKPHWKNLFSDIYYEMPHNIKNQLAELENHIQNYSNKYPVANYTSDK